MTPDKLKVVLAVIAAVVVLIIGIVIAVNVGLPEFPQPADDATYSLKIAAYLIQVGTLLVVAAVAVSILGNLIKDVAAQGAAAGLPEVVSELMKYPAGVGLIVIGLGVLLAFPGSIPGLE